LIDSDGMTVLSILNIKSSLDFILKYRKLTIQINISAIE